MARLNYHHLHYFWVVATDGNLTRAAARLHVSQSALSTQIRQLEAQFGQALFTRTGRALQLTEAGRVALAYAESIFASGNELMALLRDGRSRERHVLRVGAVATLSRNFQENFLRPLLARDDVELVLRSGSLGELVQRLQAHALDLVLSNRAVHGLAHGDADSALRSRRVARQQVSLVGRPRARRSAFRFPESLADTPMLLPGRDNDIRTAFEEFCEVRGVNFRVLAEVDDMALLRLLARDANAVALLPTIVVQDELRTGVLVEYAAVPELYESFYAITVKRRFEPPLLEVLLARPEAEVLGGSVGRKAAARSAAASEGVARRGRPGKPAGTKRPAAKR